MHRKKTTLFEIGPYIWLDAVSREEGDAGEEDSRPQDQDHAHGPALCPAEWTCRAGVILSAHVTDWLCHLLHFVSVFFLNWEDGSSYRSEPVDACWKMIASWAGCGLWSSLWPRINRWDSFVVLSSFRQIFVVCNKRKLQIASCSTGLINET